MRRARRADGVRADAYGCRCAPVQELRGPARCGPRFQTGRRHGDPRGSGESHLSGATRAVLYTDTRAVWSLPGIQSAAVAINIPMDRNMNWDLEIPGQPF